MNYLNEYAGLISLVAALAAIGAVIVPFYIYKKQREDQRRDAEENRKKEIQDAQAELDAMGVNSSPFSLYGYSKMEIARAKYLWKKAGKR